MANTTVNGSDNQLSGLYSRRNNLMEQKEKYESSLSKANSLLSELAKANNFMLIMIESLKENFSINGKTADSNKIQEASDMTSDVIISLNSQIVPEINKKISELDSQIVSINSQIASINSDSSQGK